MKRPYRIVHDTATASSRELADWLAKDGQLLVPLVELLEKGERAIDEVVDVMGRATVEAVLQADQRLADRMLELVLNGVSTRRDEQVLPAMADQVGISKSEVSRETIEAGTRVLQELGERDLSELDVLVVYLDGIVFGDYHVLAAVGVDAPGRQHTRRVSRWRNGEMAVRWAAATFCETEKNFRRVTGYHHLWMLKAHLDDADGALAEMEKAG